MEHENVCEVQQSKEIAPAVSDKHKALLFLMDKYVSRRAVAVINETMKGVLNAEKKKALTNALQKIVDQKKAREICEKAKFSLKANSFTVLPLLVFAGVILAQTQGFCDDKPLGGLDSITNNVMQVIFGPAVRKSLLVMAAGWGVFQAVTSGSFKPVLFWGGIGLSIAYVPKLIEIISNIG